MIEFRNLCHGFLRKDLFANVNMRLMPKERYGIVGANGSGKSTLLKIISTEIEADNGEVVIDQLASLFRIGQDHSLDDDKIIIDTAMMGKKEVFDAIKRQEELLTLPNQQVSAEEVARLEEVIHSQDGYRLKPLAESILAGLGIPAKFHKEPLRVLSGGYKWRCYLAQALVKSPDILMLDEPTNHLDIISIRWLELFLLNYQGTVIIVSHDKRFMDNVCTAILDIDFCTINLYAGNYTAFEKARSLFMLKKEKELLSQRKEIERKQAFVDRFRSKASKARQAQSRLKQIERIVIEEPIVSSRIHPKFVFKPADPGSKEVLNVKNLTKSYGDRAVIKNFSFNVQRKDKIAVIGPNGTGKSTLIKALAAEFKECQNAVRWGLGVLVGYFPQDCGKIIKEEDKSALEWLWQFCPEQAQSYVQGMLGRVLFSGEDAKKSTKNLSGGELSRLYLARLMILKPNVLLLDEPTNHLDLESIESLSKALEEYSGTIIAVSHDRDFIQKIASRIIEMKDDGQEEFLGNYNEFVLSRKRDFLDALEEVSLAKKATKKPDTENKTSYEDQKKRRSQLQKLNKDLAKTMLECESLEKDIATIEKTFAKEGFYTNNSHTEVLKLQQEKEKLENSLNELLQRWEGLEKELAILSLE